MDTSVPRLESRLRALSLKLCASLEAAIKSAIDDGPGAGAGKLRPVLLTSKLGLDKSLASRVVRAIGSDDPIRALHRIPTPQGLSLVANAARKAGAADGVIEELVGATEEYGELLGEFSGGRTDLEATLAGWIPEQRERAERDARRSVFRGMTTLSGTRTSAIYNCLYLVPHTLRPCASSASEASESFVNSLMVTVRQDLRRLRNGARLQAMTLQAEQIEYEAPPTEDAQGNGQKRRQVRYTLDGARLTDDPDSLLIRDLCSHPQPELELQHTGSRIVVSIHPDSLDVNEFATLGMGWRTEQHFPRYATASRQYGALTVGSSSPTEALVVDLFLHQDLMMPEAPFASSSDGATPKSPGDRPQDLPRPELEGAPVGVDLDAHPSGLSSPEIRACGAIAENACREAGFDLSEFTKYRFRIAFPTPTEQLTVWWKLPDRGQ